MSRLWEIEKEVLDGWEDAQSVLEPLMRMVTCGRAPRVLFEPLLLNVVADNVSKEIRNLVARAMNPKRKINRRDVDSLKAYISEAVSKLPGFDLLPTKRIVWLQYGLTKLLDVPVASIIGEIDWQISSALKAIAARKRKLVHVLNEELCVQDPNLPENWGADVDEDWLAGPKDARQKLNDALNSSAIGGADGVVNVIKAEATLLNFDIQVLNEMLLNKNVSHY